MIIYNCEYRLDGVFMQKNDSVIRLIDAVLIDPFNGYSDSEAIFVDPDDEAIRGDNTEKLKALILNNSVPDDTFAMLLANYPSEFASSSRLTMLNLWKLWDVADN